MTKISICIPVLNEENNINAAYVEIKNVFLNYLKNYEYEIIFTDNHSSDRTEELITSICNLDPNVKYIRFRSNLDYDKSILEGYKHSSGEATIVIDCDLQDPPELFIQFINKWKEGYDLVYGIVKSRQEGKIQNFFRSIFYKVMNLNSEFRYPKNAHDFRLVDRSVINKFKDNQNLFPYVRGLTFSVSKNPIGVTYDRKSRLRDRSKLGYYNSFTYALNAILEETFLFSKIFRRITLTIVIFFFLFSFFNIFNMFTYLSFFENLILGVLVFICSTIAIICEYITRIYFQLKKIDKNFYEKKN